jgi:hypothetical protein
MTLVKDLIPTDRVPEKVTFRIQGTTETLKGPFDFDGELEISIDLSAVGHQAMDAMTNRGRVAKKGALSVRFRGAAGRRAAPKED